MSANPRAWTVLIYFSADNDLERAAFLNHFQIVQMASNERVHILSEVDGMSQKAKRFFFGGPGKIEEFELPNEPNMGAADHLIDFVKWGSEGEHRADNYLLIIWGHGTGIDDDEDDPGTSALTRVQAETLKEVEKHDDDEGAAALNEMPELAAGPQSVAFAALSETVFTGIGDDFTHGAIAEDIGGDGPDALTCFELKHALEVIEKEVLGKKIAVLGMDACLMGMAEVAQQISGSVELMVASQEMIPDMSWPYQLILPRLLDLNKPVMTPEELSAHIVEQYIAHYRQAPPPPAHVALSVCRLAKTGELAEAIGGLGRALGTLVGDDELRKAITKARRRTQSFQFRDFIDLHHFCEVFKETIKLPRFAAARARSEEACLAAESACDAVMRVIKGEGGPGSGFVVRSGTTSPANGPLANARGIAIYFPPLPPTYPDLVLSDSARWDSFLHGYMNATFRPHALRGESAPRSIAAGSNGHNPKTEGGSVIMSANVTLPRSPRLLLPKGTTIKDAAGGYEESLTSQAFLLLDEQAKIKVPKDTELEIPVEGTKKASSGTSMKATSGTRSNALTSVELVLPPCTLHKSSSGVVIELRAGATAKTAGGAGSEPFLVLDSVEFEGQA